MAIGKGKRRYSVTLTPAIVDRFQALARDLGMPQSVMSATCDDALNGVADVLQLAKDKGSLSVSDLKRLMGQQLELIKGEEGKHAEK